MSEKQANRILAGIIGLATTAIVVFIVLSLSNSTTSHMYKVGDCVLQDDDKERWEKKNDLYFKMLEIGKSHYRTVYTFILRNSKYSSAVVESTESFSMMEYNTKKVQCPKVLERY